MTTGRRAFLRHSSAIGLALAAESVADSIMDSVAAQEQPRTRNSVTVEKQSRWHEFCRPHLEWMDFSPELDAERVAQELVQRARMFNSNTLLYAPEAGSGYLVYSGKLAPPYRYLKGQDLFGSIEHEARKSGLRFVLCVLGRQGNTYISNEHPEWIQRDKQGKIVPASPGYTCRSLCMNSPFRDYLADYVADLLQRYPLDGICM
jgi:uncharacterized lipoprotein YddW (UPF0748 family)